MIGQLNGYNDISEDKLKEKQEILEELKNKLVILKSELETIEKNIKKMKRYGNYK